MRDQQLSVPKLFRTANESEEPEVAEIQGKIPSWVQGVYIRNGPSMFDFDNNFSMAHMFDGYAMLSKFEIGHETVKMTKKYLDSQAYKTAMIVQKPTFLEFATRAYPDPRKSIFSRIIARVLPEPSDNAASNIWTMGDTVFASCEFGYWHEVDSCTLTSRKRHDTNKQFGVHGTCAHMLTDPDDGATYSIGVSLIPTVKYNVIRLPPENNRKDNIQNSKTIFTFSARIATHISFLHSFGLTQNYIVVIEQPYIMNLTRIMKSVITKSGTLRSFFEWHPNLKNKFNIIDKRNRTMIKYEFISAQPFLACHYVNCFEQDDHIVIDLVVFKNPDFIDNQYLNNMRAGMKFESDMSTIQRYVIPISPDLDTLDCGTNLITLPHTSAEAVKDGSQVILTPEILFHVGSEFPTINRKQLGKPYRYFYATAAYTTHSNQHKIYKFDIHSKEIISWSPSKNCAPGEPLFISDPEGTKEDDGIVVVPISHESDDIKDSIVFLNGKTYTEIAKVTFNSKIPLAVHGIFLPAKT